jgi:Ca-activated chloride channel homolog
VPKLEGEKSMARALFSAVVVACVACSNQEPPAEAPKVLKSLRDSPAMAEKHKKADEGQLGKKDGPKKSAVALPHGGELSAVSESNKSEGQMAKLVIAPQGAATKGLAGDAQGYGGLGLKGLAAGGGGKGETIGLGKVGTVGRGAGVGYGSGAGMMGSAQGHSINNALSGLQGGAGLGLRGTGASSGDPNLARRNVLQVPGETVVESADGVGTFENPGVNPFTTAAEDRLSTFAADVDTASYTLARRMILEGRLPPEDSVRVEEFVNYFKYSYPAPSEGKPLGVSMELAPSPFTAGRHLLKVGVQARQLASHERKVAHLTFLVDVSGSMQSPDKLPLVKKTLRMLVDQLRDGDTVALVTYAGGVKLVLPHVGMEHKARIHAAIEDLHAGGGTGMASGIALAYEQAEKVLDSSSFSRVIILSDGDANIGPSTPQELMAMIKGKVKEGVTVTTAGFGVGNYRDELMEKFADAGNGNHYYIDSAWAARRVFVEQLGSTLEVVAQDVKLQVEFDPKKVKRYRLIGYENRDVADRDFRNDKVDGGEVGTGHSVTALYELELEGAVQEGLATVRVRAKKPRGVEASEWAFSINPLQLKSTFASASPDFRFATSVMASAELFRRSPHARGWKLGEVLSIARGAAGESAERREFVQLLETAEKRSVLAVR